MGPRPAAEDDDGGERGALAFNVGAGDPVKDGRAFPLTERRWGGPGMDPRPAAEDDEVEVHAAARQHRTVGGRGALFAYHQRPR